MSLDASPYLSGLIERFGPPNDAMAEQTIAALSSATAEDLPTLKARFSLGWSYLACRKTFDFDALGRLQSAFADRAVDLALRNAWEAEKLPGDPVGLFILGLGKLGGHDLNFSSDIDLIAYYDPDRLNIPKARGQAYLLDRVMKRLTKTLMPRNDPNFVYRVDWRLRPEASGTGLAMSTTQASDFYFFRALPWHRLALLKARVVAGDRTAGEAFLSDLTPFMWRQNLDFRALDELAALKSRINLEHPRLKQERRQDRPIPDHPFGFNVKLGTGGIREVEFITNAKQLIWGGKHYALRTTNTLEALTALGREGHLETDVVDALSEAYRDHRRLENALQMMHNGHDHVLPTDHDDWQALSTLMNVPVDRLMSVTTAHRRYVHQRFQDTFARDGSHPAKPNSADPDWPDADLSLFGDATRPVVEDWMSGFRRHGIRASRTARLEPLGAALAQRAARADSPDQAVPRIDGFLRKLSRSEQYLRLLSSHPGLLDALIDPLLYSPHMSVLLEQSPHLIDTFLDPSPPSPAFVLAETDYETRLERLRRFVNEGLFQHYHAFLSGVQDWRGLAAGLTALAETCIETALAIARDDLEVPDLPIAVLGLGKLGQSLMAPQSDLDLVFLFEDGVDRDLAAKAVRRLRTIMTTPLREGIAYELDMRLRPSGRSGPPAVTLSAFMRHHEGSARNWEHIALVPARVVAGDNALGARVTQELANILSRPRDQAQLLSDAHYMWNKISDERIHAVPPNRFDTKLRDGGLMMADYWGSVGMLCDGLDLGDAREAWTAILYWERLLGLTGAPLTSIPDRYAPHLPVDLETMQGELQVQVIDTVSQFGGRTDAISMDPVHWV
ncbi:MAG: hypothetical protein AAF926_02815 [Pseudomonadota bacterium]